MVIPFVWLSLDFFFLISGHSVAGLLTEMIHQVSVRSFYFVFFVFQQKTNAIVEAETWFLEVDLKRVMPPCESD